MDERECVFALRILVALAKCDGTLLDEERLALESSLEGIPLPDGVTLETLIAERTDAAAFDENVRGIRSTAGREATYQAALRLAHVDGVASAEERALLEKLEREFAIGAKRRIFSHLVEEAKDTILPSHIEKTADPAERATAIDGAILKYAIMSAVLGAFPIPGLAIASDLAVVALQAKLARDVGQHYGHTVDPKATRSLLGGIVGGAGMRIAVNNLVKLVPGWGSVVGATTSFATTFAVGRVAERYFQGGGAVATSELRAEFASAKAEGKRRFKENEATVREAAEAKKAALLALADELREGRITQDEYDAKVTELA